MLNCCKILLWEGGIQKFNCQISRKGETGTFIPNGLEFFIGGSDCRIFFFFHKWKDGVYTNSLKSIQEIKMAGFFAINSQFLRNPISTCSFGN
jgi:hypothetical protein